MKRWGWLGVAVLLAGCHRPAALTDALPKQVLGSPYAQARRILLAQGYKTANFGPSDALRRRSEMCEDLQGQRCRTYLETWDCHGTGDCEFDFIRAADHRVLRVMTDGEFPPSVADARWASPDELAQRNITNK